MAKQKGNEQKNWLLPLMRHRYIALSISILFLPEVGVALYPARAFFPGSPPKIGQLPAKTVQDPNRDAADRTLEEGIKLYLQEVSDSLRQAIQLHQQGTADSLQQAIKKYEEALAVFRKVGNKEGEGAILLGIGDIYRNLAEIQKALDYSNQGLSVLREARSYSGIGTALNNIASIYLELGEKQKALEYYNQTLSILQEYGNQDLPTSNKYFTIARIALTINNIASIYLELGEKQKALQYYNQALLLSRQVGDKRAEGLSFNNIGRVYQELGEKQQALEYYNQALYVRRAIGHKNGEAITLNNIGSIYENLGEKQKALKYYNQALPLSRQVGNRSLESAVLGNIATFYQDTKQINEAIKYLEQSVLITLQLRDTIGGGVSKTTARNNRKTFLENKLGAAIGLIDLLINQNKAESAFEWANLATVADLADYSRLVNAKVANQQAQKVIDQWNQKNIQLERLRKELQEQFSPELSKLVNQLQEQLNLEAENIRNRFLEVADLFETKPTDITKLKASIPIGTTVIQPVLLTNIQDVPNTIALFVLTKDKLKVIKVPIDPDKFDALLTQTYASLTNRFDTQYLDNLEKLYELLIRPVEAEIQATKPEQLSIIATGKLRYIPFEALYDAKIDQYLIQKYPISYLTRLSTRSLQAKGTQTTADAKKVLAFGNPVTKPPLALPGAEAEVKSITQIFPGSEAFVNSKATFNTFKIQSLRFSLLHLATHGCFQKGGCPKLGLEENILLFADQKFNIRDAALLGLKNVDLIVLSACQTALETNSNGEEIAGLAYLFERAGSRAVIASLWSAEDETTKAIMVEFYKNLKKGISKNKALHQAKLSQINEDGVLPHPFFWSPFVLIGDAQ